MLILTVVAIVFLLVVRNPGHKVAADTPIVIE